MKLLSFRRPGERMTEIGCVSADGRIVELASAYAACLEGKGGRDPIQIAHESIPSDMIDFIKGGEKSLRAAETALACAEDKENKGSSRRDRFERFLVSQKDIEFLPPIMNPGKIIGAGMNYPEHIAEGGNNRPEVPLAFLKASSALIGHGGEILWTEETTQLDYEIELAFVIGKKGKHITRDEAIDYVYGYTILNDVSERGLQLLHEMKVGTILGCKSMDTFGPLGPWIVTKDEIENPHNLDLILRVNGEVRQNSNTKYMIVDIFDQIAYWSKLMTLYPGDIFSTGTPSGCALGYKPDPKPYYLKPGDIVEAEIERLGTLMNKVVKEGKGQ